MGRESFLKQVTQYTQNIFSLPFPSSLHTSALHATRLHHTITAQNSMSRTSPSRLHIAKLHVARLIALPRHRIACCASPSCFHITDLHALSLIALPREEGGREPLALKPNDACVWQPCKIAQAQKLDGQMGIQQNDEITNDTQHHNHIYNESVIIEV